MLDRSCWLRGIIAVPIPTADVVLLIASRVHGILQRSHILGLVLPEYTVVFSTKFSAVCEARHPTPVNPCCTEPSAPAHLILSIVKGADVGATVERTDTAAGYGSNDVRDLQGAVSCELSTCHLCDTSSGTGRLTVDFEAFHFGHTLYC